MKSNIMETKDSNIKAFTYYSDLQERGIYNTNKITQSVTHFAHTAGLPSVWTQSQTAITSSICQLVHILF